MGRRTLQIVCLITTFTLISNSVVLVAAAAPQKQILPPDMERQAISSLNDPTLDATLEWLARNDQIVPQERDATRFGKFEGGMLVIPLADTRYPQRFLWLFYLQNPRQYFFLQVAKDAQGKEEARLWGSGNSELLIKLDEVRLLQTKSVETFRIPLTVLNSGDVFVNALTADEALNCIARTLALPSHS